MIKWPEKLKNGREAGKLPGIGPSISAKLDEKLKQFNVENGLIPEIPDGAIILSEEVEAKIKKTKPRTTTTTTTTTKTKTKIKDKNKEYVPIYRSASYAVLLALLLHLHQDTQNGPLNKSELILKAQGFSTSPLNDGMFPSINGALKTLEEKGLIRKFSNPPHFGLTVKGAELAERLWQSGEKRPSQTALPKVSPSRLYKNSDENLIENENENKINLGERIKKLETFYWPIGSFEIVLLIDVREIRSREDRNYLTERMNQLGITSEVRNLELGDFVWIARLKKNRSMINSNWTDSEEIVLDTLIERKREDDLIASISDGRFKEQKHRIRGSLLNSTFYLVERGGGGGGAGAHEFLGGAEERLLGAALQCQVIDGLMYRQTGGLDESIVFLATLHKSLIKKYNETGTGLTGCALKAVDFNFKEFPLQFSELKKQTTVVFMNYTAYALLNSKSTNQSPTDIFLKQLLTIKGVTFDRACAILSKFPTPTELYKFYRNLPNELAKRDAFKEFQFMGEKKFGVALSNKIYEVFGVN